VSTSEAVLELVLKARNLAEGATTELAQGLDKIGSNAGAAAGKVTRAFSGMGNALANAVGNSVENLTTGGDLGPTLLMAGGYMAGQLAEQFGGQLIERLAGSALIGAIAAPLGALGSAAGGLIAAAIPIGMALLPAILIAALVAAVTILIVNEDIRNKVIGFAAGLVGNLADALGRFLGVLPQVVGAAFAKAWDFIITSVVPFIGKLVGLWLSIPFRLAGLGLSILRTIIDGLAGLPGAVARIVGDAFRSLKIDIGPFHISGGGITIDLPEIHLPGLAVGVQNFAGGLAVVGEHGPEVVRLPRGADVIPNGGTIDGAGGGSTFRIVGVSARELDKMVDRGSYFRLQRSVPVRGR